MQTDHRKAVEEFLEIVSSEITFGPHMKNIAGVFLFGSYTRAGPFNDIDIMPLLRGRYDSRSMMETETKPQRDYLQSLLKKGEEVFGIPPFQVHAYMTILTKLPHDIENEISQLEKQIREFYDFNTKLNKLPKEMREEYGLLKEPRDFRFSDKSRIYERYKPGRDTVIEALFNEEARSLLRCLNKEYAKEEPPLSL